MGVYIRSQFVNENEKQIYLINSFTNRYSAIVYNIPEKIIIENLSLSNLSENEKYKLIRDMRCYFDLCFDEYTMYINKFIKKPIWKTWNGGMRHAMQRKPFQEAWEIIKKDTRYENTFDKYIDKLYTL